MTRAWPVVCGTLAGLLLGGCVSSTPVPGPGDGTGAVFVHPISGAIQHCEHPGWTAQLMGPRCTICEALQHPASVRAYVCPAGHRTPYYGGPPSTTCPALVGARMQCSRTARLEAPMA